MKPPSKIKKAEKRVLDLAKDWAKPCDAGCGKYSCSTRNGLLRAEIDHLLKIEKQK